MHRPTVGVIALVLLVAGAICENWKSTDTDLQQFSGAFLRIGSVMAVLWLALPQTRQLNKLYLAAILIFVVVLLWRPKLLPLLFGFMLLFALLRPRLRKRPARARERERKK